MKEFTTKELKKYAEGFKNGTFSTKHEYRDKLVSNCSSTGEVFCEEVLFRALSARGNRLAHVFLSNRTYESLSVEHYRKEKITTEEKEPNYSKTVIEETWTSFFEYHRMTNDLKFHRIPEELGCDDNMWFVFWGEGTLECWGSKGDGCAFWD